MGWFAVHGTFQKRLYSPLYEIPNESPVLNGDSKKNPAIYDLRIWPFAEGLFFLFRKVQISRILKLTNWWWTSNDEGHFWGIKKRNWQVIHGVSLWTNLHGVNLSTENFRFKQYWFFFMIWWIWIIWLRLSCKSCNLTNFYIRVSQNFYFSDSLSTRKNGVRNLHILYATVEPRKSFE